MSFDRQLDQLCPHRVVEETLFLNDDLQTVRPLRPISAAATVEVRLDSTVVVPSIGVQQPAKVVGGKTGPFNITAGSTDQLVLSIDGGPVQTITVPPGRRLSAAQVARSLNPLVQDGVVNSSNDRIVIQSGRVGKAAQLHIRNGSTLASVLGLVQDRVFKGVKSVPGWSLVRDPNTLSDRPIRLIVFDQPLRGGLFDFVELNYYTVREECRRCGGLGVENDWRYGSKGNTAEVRDEALLLQEILKITYTLRGSNPFHLWYGTTLVETIGRKLSAGGLIQNLILTEINTAFSRWQSIKRQQEEDVGQFVSDREFPFQLLNVSVEQSTQDPTVIFVNATIQNRSGEPIQIERGIRLPEPADILGSSAAQGVFRQSLNNFVLTG